MRLQSNGMLCSGNELELVDDVNGLLLLDASAPTGVAVAEHLRLNDTALEINGSPRLDLDDSLARAAGRAGATLTLASDAHRTEELAQQAYAVDLARRAWLGPEQLLATRTADELLAGLA